MILYVDFVKQWQRVPRTLKRLRRFETAIGEPVTFALANDAVGEASDRAREIGGPGDYDILARVKGFLPRAAATVNDLAPGDAFICRGAGIAKRLHFAGAKRPSCLRVIYLHDDPFPNSVRDNDAAMEWINPHIVFAMQPGRVEHYKRQAEWAEWCFYGVDTDLFYPRDAEVEHDVVMGSHVPSKIYQVRFDWMNALAETFDAVIKQNLTYADYVNLLASAHLCVDIPNSRQLLKGGAWSWQVAYRAFEIAAMGKPNLLPSLPGYREAFEDTAFFYAPSYGGFERSVKKLLRKRSDTLDRYVEAALKKVGSDFSMRAAVKREVEVIKSMRSRT